MKLKSSRSKMLSLVLTFALMASMMGIGSISAYGADDVVTNEDIEIETKALLSDAVCAIGEIHYATLDDALNATTTGASITLLTNIDYDKGMIIKSKNITFNLNGSTLNVANNLGGAGLVVENGSISLEGNGAFNVTKGNYGVYATNSTVTVTNVTATENGSCGVYASASSTITVTGDATGVQNAVFADGSTVFVNGNATAIDDYSNCLETKNGGSITVKGDINGKNIGAYSSGEGSNITVEGNILVTAPNSIGAYGLNGGKVKVGGYVHANYIGAYAGKDGIVTVTGDVKTSNLDGYGAYAGKANGTSASVIIDGLIIAVNYIKIDSYPKNIWDMESSTTKPGYRTYANGASTVWVKDTPLVSVVCSIDENEYTTLNEALSKVTSGKTIKLLKDISYDGSITINIKNIVFDLNGFNLDVKSISGPGLKATSSMVDIIGSGEFNVTGTSYGVESNYSTVNVTNITSTAPNSYGAYAYNGGIINAKGNVQGVGTESIGAYAEKKGRLIIDGDVEGKAYGAFSSSGGIITIGGNAEGKDKGVYATELNSSITVSGNVTATGSSSTAALAEYKGKVTVYGDNVIGGRTGAYASGAGSIVIITGNITTTGAGGWGAYSSEGMITIDGIISSAANYIKVGDVLKLKGNHTLPTTKPGYLTYTDGTSTVWVRGGDVPIVAKIGESSYATLGEALSSIGEGQSKTIQLLADIEYTSGIVIIDRSVTFDLYGFILNVTNSLGNGLEVKNGSLDLIGTGEFNVTGTSYGVAAYESGRATVTNAKSTLGGYGAYATGNVTGGNVHVKGNATVASGGNSYGAYADAVNGGITIDGNAEAIQGVYASGANTRIIVKGNVTATGSSNDDAAATAINDAMITIEGNIKAQSSSAAKADTGGNITVNGSIAALRYLKVGNVFIMGDEKNRTIPTTKPGYHTYSVGTSTLWVKEVSQVGKEFTELKDGINFKYRILTEGASGNTVEVINNNYYKLVAKTLTIPDTVIHESITYRVSSIGFQAFINCKSFESIIIPETVTNIGDYTFQECQGLREMIIPESVISIGKGAFQGCFSLKNVNIPNGVKNIESTTFQRCGLTSIHLPDSVVTIGSAAFDACTNLTSITIPDSVTSIGGGAFNLCKSLTSIKIPSTVTDIGQNTFLGCTNLTSIIIPQGVISIGESAFGGCSSLSSIIIPNSVASIGMSAFAGCSSLEAITIPEGVATINEYTFSNCTKLEEITFLKTTPPIINDSFQGTSIGIIYVPTGCKENYESLVQPFAPLENVEIKELGSVIPKPEAPTFYTNLTATKSIFMGEKVSLTVVASVKDGGKLSYQWYKDDVAIAGAAGASYTIINAIAMNRGSYKVVVTNTKDGLEAKTTSQVCILTVKSSGGGSGGGGGSSGGGSSSGGTSGTIIDQYVQSQYILEESKVVRVDLEKGSTKLSASQVRRLIEQNNNKPVVITNVNYTLTFPIGTMRNFSMQENFDFGTRFNTGLNYNKIKEISGKNFALMISYNQVGKLPGEAKIRVNLGTQYVGKIMNYYYYNTATQSLEYAHLGIVDTDGFITVNQSLFADHVFVVNTNNYTRFIAEISHTFEKIMHFIRRK